MTDTGGGEPEAQPRREANDQYPGLPGELQDHLRQAAVEGRDTWLERRLDVHGAETPAFLDERVDGTVFLRQADPSNPPDPPRILVRPGDRVALTTPVAAAGMTLTDEVGRIDDLITSVRVVLDRREAGNAYGRSLREGEPDDGRRIHVRPGEQLIFEPGALRVSLDAIDRDEPPIETGHVNLAPVIWAEGADVLISYLDEEEDAQGTARLVEQAGRKAVLVPGDVSQPQHCRDIIARAVQEFGKVEILVSNAAYQMNRPSLEEIPDQEWDYTFDTNVGAFFHTAKAAVPHMSPGSSIVGSSSVNSDSPSPTLAPYAATKAAIANFCASLAQMLGDRGTRVNSVAPGPIWTPLIPATMAPEKVEQCAGRDRGRAAGTVALDSGSRQAQDRSLGVS